MKPLAPVALVCAFLVASACGEVSTATVKPAGPLQGTALVLLDQAAGSVVVPVDLATGRAGQSLPAGVMSRDGRRLFSVSGTSLREFDAVTGASIGSFPIPAGMVLPQIEPGIPAGFSHNEGYLVLESIRSQTAQSSFWVFDVAASKGTTANLNGRFEFDGISDDGSALYLLQWLPNQPGRYSVRQYEVQSGILEPYILTDKLENVSSMQGTRLASVSDPAGRWQYTLYVGGSTGAFIHALQTTGGFSVAWCVDLPATDPVTAQSWSLAMPADGRALYAANPAAGKLLTIHPRGMDKPTIDRTAYFGSTGSLPGVRVAEAKEGTGGLGVLDGPRMYVRSQTGVVAIDVESGRQAAALFLGHLLRSVVMAPGAGRLLAIDDNNRLLSADTPGGATKVVTPSLGYAHAILGVSQRQLPL